MQAKMFVFDLILFSFNIKCNFNIYSGFVFKWRKVHKNSLKTFHNLFRIMIKYPKTILDAM